MLPVILQMPGSNMGKRVRLTRKTRPGISIQRRGDGKDCGSLFPRRGGGEVCTGTAWNLLSEATGVGVPAGQSSRSGRSSRETLAVDAMSVLMAHWEPLQGGVSDDCVLSGVTSSSQSQWPTALNRRRRRWWRGARGRRRLGWSM